MALLEPFENPVLPKPAQTICSKQAQPLKVSAGKAALNKHAGRVVGLKNFSAAAYAGATSGGVGYHGAPVSDPLALFTDFQWFLYRARNTVYFTSFSDQSFDKERLMSMVAMMVSLAPQLTHGFKGATPGAPLPQHLLEAITSIMEVDSFDNYPDVSLTPALELFEDKSMPLFRVRAFVRRGGPDAKGRSSMILVQSAHAMMEGADSAMLTRSHSAARAPGASELATGMALRQRISVGLIGALSAPLHLVLGQILAPKSADMHFATLVFERARMRRVADRLGVAQRSLMFALVLYALNKHGTGFSDKKIKTAYTTLDDDRTRKGDDYFRVRVINASFDVEPDLEKFVKAVDAEINAVEAKDTAHMQMVINAIFTTHRILSRFLPFLYTQRFFRFNSDCHAVLTLVPPHRIAGRLTQGLTEPVYCGSYHPGTNLCTFVPGREYVTFNFSIRPRHAGEVKDVEALLAGLDRGA